MPATMTASERANLPRWRGDAGFVEIWFLVVFHPPTESALWLRYTTFAPARGAPGAARAIVWAAWFDARAAAPAVAVKAIHPAAAYHAGQPGRFGIRIGSCVLASLAAARQRASNQIIRTGDKPREIAAA